MTDIDIHIERSPHVTATDFDFLDAMVRDPRFHMYAPELDGVDDTTLTGIRKLAAGDSKVYRDIMSRTDKDSMWAKTFSALFMLRKPIEAFDVTPEQYRENPALRDFGQVTVDLSRVSANEYIDSMPSTLQRLSTFITARDSVISQNIVERLPVIVNENRKLKELGKVGLLITIGDNHRLVDGFLRDHGFAVTTNDIPVTGVQEHASFEYLDGRSPSEDEILEAAAYSIVRSFVKHPSTYELRRQLNLFAQGFKEDDIASLLLAAKTEGITGIERFVINRIESMGEATDLTFVASRSHDSPIRLKETYERQGMRMGVRSSIF